MNVLRPIAAKLRYVEVLKKVANCLSTNEGDSGELYSSSQSIIVKTLTLGLIKQLRESGYSD